MVPFLIKLHKAKQAWVEMGTWSLTSVMCTQQYTLKESACTCTMC